MAKVSFELDAEVRSDMGKGASRRLRHANQVPAVVYGANEPAQSLTLNHDKVVTALSNEAFYSHILTLNINGKAEKVILKALQRNPAKPRVAHMDFLRVRMDQKITMRVPLHFLNEDKAPGVREGGVVTHGMTDVEVSCLPANLPEYIEVDIINLGMDQTLHLTDIKAPQGVDFVAFAHGVEDHDLPVVSIHMPRIDVEEVPVAAAEEGAEGAATAEGAEGAATEASAGEKKDKE